MIAILTEQVHLPLPEFLRQRGRRATVRVLIITALYPPAIGGAATYFGDIVPDLARRDEIEQLVVLTERMSGQPRRQSEGRLRVLRYRAGPRQPAPAYPLAGPRCDLRA